MEQTFTIPLDEAVNRVSHFREHMSNYLPQQDIPRAVLIPLGAIQDMLARYGTDIQGLRAYFSMEGGPETTAVNAVIVAVDQQGKDIIQASRSESGDDPDDSDVYNFTKPCPTSCDTTSPLFIEP